MRVSNDAVSDFKANLVASEHVGTALLILTALAKGDYNLLETLDNNNKDRRMVWLYRDLVYKGYLSENEDAGDNILFNLTQKSKDLLNTIDANDQAEPEEEPRFDFEKAFAEITWEPGLEEERPKVTKATAKLSELKNYASSWIEEWLRLFPTKRADGYLLRAGKNLCINKMSVFLRDNPNYTKETIFDATKLYLEQQKHDGYKYTKIASNFIYKNESGRGSIRDSALEAYCQAVDSGLDEPSKYSHLEDNNPFI